MTNNNSHTSPAHFKAFTPHGASRLALSAIVACIICMLTIACTDNNSSNPGLKISNAEFALQEGDLAKAVDLCNDIKHSSDSTALSYDHLCRMSLIYTAAADRDIDSGANMAQAVECLENALALDQDSTYIFIENLPMDQLASIRVALMLLDSKGLDITDYVDEDSTLVADQMIHHHDHVE